MTQTSARLSPRREQVASLVAAGLLNKEIAQRLGIAEATVKNHLQTAYERTGCRNRIELALWWLAAKPHLSREAPLDLASPARESSAKLAAPELAADPIGSGS